MAGVWTSGSYRCQRWPARSAASLPRRRCPQPRPPRARPSRCRAHPAGYTVGPREAVAIAGDNPVVAEYGRYGRLETVVVATDDGAWQIGYRADGREVAQVIVDGSSAAVREA